VFADLKQNAPGRGRTLLLIYVVIEAMITFIAVQDNTRIGLFGQSLFPNIGACSQCSPRKPGREAVSLSTEPTNWVRDNGIRVFYTLSPNSTSLISGSAFLNGVRFSHPWLILSTGGSHQYHDVLSVGVGA
jgi:hypothetical protein